MMLSNARFLRGTVGPALRGAGAALLPAILLVLASAGTLAAQSPLASQTLGRGYWHMFLGYAVAWILILGWIWSIARRLGRVERKLDDA